MKGMVVDTDQKAKEAAPNELIAKATGLWIPHPSIPEYVGASTEIAKNNYGLDLLTSLYLKLHSSTNESSANLNQILDHAKQLIAHEQNNPKKLADVYHSMKHSIFAVCTYLLLRIADAGRTYAHDETTELAMILALLTHDFGANNSDGTTAADSNAFHAHSEAKSIITRIEKLHRYVHYGSNNNPLISWNFPNGMCSISDLAKKNPTGLLMFVCDMLSQTVVVTSDSKEQAVLTMPREGVTEYDIPYVVTDAFCQAVSLLPKHIRQNGLLRKLITDYCKHAIDYYRNSDRSALGTTYKKNLNEQCVGQLNFIIELCQDSSEV